MATKWKNTVKKIQGFLKLHLTQEIYILGALLLFIGAALFYSVIVYRTWHITAEAIFLGVLGKSVYGSRSDHYFQRTAETAVRRYVDA